MLRGLWLGHCDTQLIRSPEERRIQTNTLHGGHLEDPVFEPICIPPDPLSSSRAVPDTGYGGPLDSSAYSMSRVPNAITPN